MTCRRSRIGSAWTVANPVSVAAAANTRPPAPRVGEVDVGDGLAGGEAVQAGALVVLQLEQLQQPGRLVGVGDHLQAAPLVVEHQPGGCRRR